MTLVDISHLNLCSCLSTTEIGGREELKNNSVSLPGDIDGVGFDNEFVRGENLVSYFRTKIAEIPNKSTSDSRQKAFNAFLNFIGGDEVSVEHFAETYLLEWAAWLIQNGYTQKTAAFYLKQLGTLYNQAAADGLVPQSDALGIVRKRLLAIPEADFSEMATDLVNRLRIFLQSWSAGHVTKGLATDIIAFAILNGGMSFEQIANYKKADYQGNDELLKRVVDKYAQPRNKYLFPLGQSVKTSAQMKKELSKLFYIALTPYGLSLSKDEETTATDLWSLAALQNGVAPRVLLGMTDGYAPSFNPVYGLLKPVIVIDEEKVVIQKRLIASLTANPTHWYAMQFRPRVKFEQVKQALEAIKDEVKCTDLFYPSEEIMRRVGNKMVKECKPIIPGLLFFRSRPTDITTIFRHIGNLAWCYRQTNDRTSPYAVIPTSEILAYQTVIGQFSSDIELLPEGTLSIKENDRVIILGGNLVGQEATVTGVKASEGGRTIYKLSFIGNNSIEWAVTAAPRLLEKTTCKELLIN
ncbi:MAG: phage integrase SAM-like domain-containing protein [Muribaculaceae bacterium]|nr:phage integrase SAM-like domain-containing protein [Muribaculaceae bacterium]